MRWNCKGFSSTKKAHVGWIPRCNRWPKIIIPKTWIKFMVFLVSQAIMRSIYRTMHIWPCCVIEAAEWVSKMNWVATAASHSTRMCIQCNLCAVGRQRRPRKRWIAICKASMLALWVEGGKYVPHTHWRNYAVWVVQSQKRHDGETGVIDFWSWKLKSSRDTVPYIWQSTPNDLWCSCELALLPPLGQQCYCLYRPCLFRTHTDTTLTHSTTNGVLSDFAKLYLHYQVHPRCKKPGGWCTDEMSAL